MRTLIMTLMLFAVSFVFGKNNTTFGKKQHSTHDMRLRGVEPRSPAVSVSYTNLFLAVADLPPPVARRQEHNGIPALLPRVECQFALLLFDDTSLMAQQEAQRLLSCARWTGSTYRHVPEE